MTKNFATLEPSYLELPFIDLNTGQVTDIILILYLLYPMFLVYSCILFAYFLSYVYSFITIYLFFCYSYSLFFILLLIYEFFYLFVYLYLFLFYLSFISLLALISLFVDLFHVYFYLFLLFFFTWFWFLSSHSLPALSSLSLVLLLFFLVFSFLGLPAIFRFGPYFYPFPYFPFILLILVFPNIDLFFWFRVYIPLCFSISYLPLSYKFDLFVLVLFTPFGSFHYSLSVLVFSILFLNLSSPSFYSHFAFPYLFSLIPLLLLLCFTLYLQLFLYTKIYSLFWYWVLLWRSRVLLILLSLLLSLVRLLLSRLLC